MRRGGSSPWNTSLPLPITSGKKCSKTRADHSCLVSIAGEGLVDVPAVKLPKEKVIDTTAAGDSFSAGYLAVRLTGGSAEEAAKRGHLTASTVIQYRGAIIPREAMPA